MSNVLIGIIGVILFIGLALAGALFLGPEFQRSTNNSRAAAITQGASQIANAVNLKNVQTGNIVLASAAPSSLTVDYLKSVPAPVVTTQTAYVLADAALASVGGAAFVTTTLPGSVEICDAIERQAGGASTGSVKVLTKAAAVTAIGGRLAGCVNIGLAGAEVPTVYVRI